MNGFAQNSEIKTSKQRGQAPLPDLFFFERLSGMNKSGRGACPLLTYQR